MHYLNKKSIKGLNLLYKRKVDKYENKKNIVIN